MDINKALKTAITTGNVLFGYEQTMKSLKSGKAKLIIVASNCPEVHVESIGKHKDIPLHRFSGNNIELGSACGKPFSVSTVSIVDEGRSGILALGKNK